jgi:hypothetical protein
VRIEERKYLLHAVIGISGTQFRTLPPGEPFPRQTKERRKKNKINKMSHLVHSLIIVV